MTRYKLSRSDRYARELSVKHAKTVHTKKAAMAGTLALSLAAPMVSNLPLATAIDPVTVEASTDQARNFIRSIGPDARVIAQNYNLYASVMIAQACLESAYGTSQLSSQYHNYFGIKGDDVYMPTQEFLNGVMQNVNEPFAAYSSLSGSLYDYAKLLAGNSYYRGAWKSNAATYADAAYHLQGRYATDPNYASKIISVINTYNLTQYDTPASTGSSTATSDRGTTHSGDGSYTVQEGDSLWTISQNQGVGLKTILSLNGLTENSTIVPGQVLNMTSPGASSASTGGATTTSSNSGSGAYTVQEGDSLWSIADNYNMTLDQLTTGNSIDADDTIQVGQVLWVASSNTAVTSSHQGTSVVSGASTHTVRPGESLWSISQAHGVSFQSLLTVNQMSEGETIHPGDVIYLA
jgi:flagellum-specific peptidoglycan hydrolase FlgJ